MRRERACTSTCLPALLVERVGGWSSSACVESVHVLVYVCWPCCLRGLEAGHRVVRREHSCTNTCLLALLLEGVGGRLCMHWAIGFGPVVNAARLSLCFRSCYSWLYCSLMRLCETGCV